MRKTITTLVAAMYVAGAATSVWAVDGVLPGQPGALSAWDYQVPSARVASTASLSQMPMLDVSYQVTDQVSPAVLAPSSDAACCDAAGCGDACGCGDSCGCDSCNSC